MTITAFTQRTVFKQVEKTDISSMVCSHFDPVRDLSDLTGKVAIVTGANTGIGYSTVKHLARQGAKVYLAARNDEKAKAALERLHEEGIGSGEVVYLHLDLANARAVKRIAEEFMQKEKRLDILINNAAILFADYKVLEEGLSEHMMVCHFAAFLFTQTLLPLLVATTKEPGSDVRIVAVSSAGHGLSRATEPGLTFKSIDDFNKEYAEDVWPNFSRYTMTKLCNVLYMKTLQARLDAKSIPITCLSLHPGGVNTWAKQSPYPRLSAVFLKIFFVHPDKGAYTSCFAAASPLVKENPEKYKGKYLTPVGVVTPVAKNAQRDELGEQLWEQTVDFLSGLGLLDRSANL